MKATALVVAIVILTSLTCFAADSPQLLLAASGSRSWDDASLVLPTSGDMPSVESGYRLSSSEGLVPDRIAFESVTSVSVDNKIIVVGPIPTRSPVVVGGTLRSRARGDPS